MIAPIPIKREAFSLFREGSIVLSEVSTTGMRIDTEYLDRAIDESAVQINKMEDRMKADPIYDDWKREYGQKTNLGSGEQLADIIFNKMGIPCKKISPKTGKPSVDAEALEDVDLPFVKRWQDVEKLKKCRTTYLIGIRNETVDGILHPSFPLNFVSTFRSSSRDPNFTNMPIRDPRLAKLVRRAFIPRNEHHVWLESDYAALEFRGNASFWGDEAMIEYASDPNLDIHRDIAMEVFMLSMDEWDKVSRFHAKNGFVFPILYGSYYRSCARNLWNQIGREKIKTRDGVCLYEHLKSKGIRELGATRGKERPQPGTFEKHIQNVEEKFNLKFPTWSDEKEKWQQMYNKRGWFQMPTGFVCKGVFTRNFIMNSPVQGSSFHCLLWSLIQIHNWLKKNKMRSKVIGEIHDSNVLDVHEDELDDVLEKIHQVMTKDLRDHWSWIKTPMQIEVETSRTNWFEKKPLELNF